MFIVLEGLDGAGKSTQIAKLRDMFRSKGVESEYLHFPRFDAPIYGELIARFLRGDLGSVESVNPYLVALLYAGDRADAAKTINGWLAEGKVVICDRYIDSTIAYQYFGRQLSGEFMGTITKYAIDGLMPEATVILELSPEAAEKRYTQRAQAKQADYDVPDRLEQERAEFKERVNQGFKYMAENYSDRIITIDASGTIDQVWDAILAGLKERGVLC